VHPHIPDGCSARRTSWLRCRLAAGGRQAGQAVAAAATPPATPGAPPPSGYPEREKFFVFTDFAPTKNQTFFRHPPIIAAKFKGFLS
jgi:hypothetical protein